jgi:hypothetical protein
VGNRAVRSTKILLHTGKRTWNQKELTKEEFQSRLREEVIGGGFESDKANELAMDGFESDKAKSDKAKKPEVDGKKDTPKKNHCLHQIASGTTGGELPL